VTVGRLRLRTGEIVELDNQGWHCDEDNTVEDLFNVAYTASRVLDGMEYYANPLRAILDAAAEETGASILQYPSVDRSDDSVAY
jgi:hypothetical protein